MRSTRLSTTEVFGSSISRIAEWAPGFEVLTRTGTALAESRPSLTCFAARLKVPSLPTKRSLCCTLPPLPEFRVTVSG